jgi:hypothetical protein
MEVSCLLAFTGVQAEGCRNCSSAIVVNSQIEVIHPVSIHLKSSCDSFRKKILVPLISFSSKRLGGIVAQCSPVDA